MGFGWVGGRVGGWAGGSVLCSRCFTESGFLCASRRQTPDSSPARFTQDASRVASLTKSGLVATGNTARWMLGPGRRQALPVHTAGVNVSRVASVFRSRDSVCTECVTQCMYPSTDQSGSHWTRHVLCHSRCVCGLARGKRRHAPTASASPSFAPGVNKPCVVLHTSPV